MSLFDLIVEAANKVKSNGAGLYNKIKGVQAPQLNLELLSEDGGTDVTKTMEMLDKTTPLTFGERMTGRKLSRDFQKYNPETKQFEMTTATINRPGLLQDISQGYEENRFTPVSLDNLQQNTLDNGREKGFVYRLGEGLGSLARLGNSPLGRGLLVGGLVGATGGNGLEALTYGAGATMLNQGNVLRDRTYRNDLINTQKQSLMSSPEWNNLTPAQQQARLSEIENSINNYRGYMTDDIYKNLVNTQQARDNAAYRQMYFDAQLENQKRNEALARERFEYQKTQDKIQNNMAWEKLKNDKNNGPVSFSAITTVRKEFEGLPVIKNFNEINRQMGNVKSIYEKYKQGNLKANANDQVLITTINKILDPTSVVRESEFNRTAQGQALTDKLQGYLRKISKGGSGLTDAERNDMFEAMETMYLATQQEAYNAAEYYTDLAMRYNINPADIVSPKYLKPKEMANNSQENQVIQSGKYKVRVR